MKITFDNELIWQIMCPLNTERCGRTTEIVKERNETGVVSYASNPRSVENEKKNQKEKKMEEKRSD